MKRFLLSIVYAVSALTAMAQDAPVVTINGITYNIYKTYSNSTGSYTYDAGVAQPADGVTYSGDMVIPKTVEYEGNTCTVTGIDGYAFASNEDITSVKLPETIQTIGGGAFQNCPNLKSLNIPAKVKSIGDYALCDLPLFTELVLGDSLKSIGGGAFGDDVNLKKVTLKDKVGAIGSGAFSGCPLEQFDIMTSKAPFMMGAFDSDQYEKLTVRVQKGTKDSYYEHYIADDGTDYGYLSDWNKFKNLVEYDFSTTGIAPVKTLANVAGGEKWYTLDGQQLPAPAKGLNIKVVNGKATKLLVK